LLRLANNASSNRESIRRLGQLFAISDPNDNLTYTNIEVATIARRFPTRHIYAKDEAKKQTLLQPPAINRLQTSPWLHFSCHGYFNWNVPLNSALALCGCCISPAPADADTNQRYLKLTDENAIDLTQCLTLGDIFQLSLSQCRLVTLSACETALTDATGSSDEYISLGSGFLKAGSLSVVSSLWAVDDFSTALLMMRFYANLPHYSTIACALNEAQCWLRNVTQAKLLEWIQKQDMDASDKDKMRDYIEFRYRRPQMQPFSQPYHWAGFCSIGV
jgi:CHAT domain-containing protein